MENIAPRQHPLGTPFTAASTADDVLAGVDLSGTNVVVTGGHSGLGHETIRALAAAGASVVVASRNPEKAQQLLADVPGVETSALDLADPASIDAFVERFLASGRPLHVLLNNAGLMGGPLVRDARGYESQFATNHLGHFQLTLGLLPALRAAGSARVVNLTSGAHRGSDIRWDDPHFTDGYDEAGMTGYAQSKAANVLFAVELDRRWSGDGIRGYAVHPGIVVTTNLGPARAEGAESVGGADEQALQAMRLLDDEGHPVLDPFRERKTVQQGASTSVFAATSSLLADIGGVYLKDNDVSAVEAVVMSTEIAADQTPRATAAPHALDPTSARRLWELSERLLAA